MRTEVRSGGKGETELTEGTEFSPATQERPTRRQDAGAPVGSGRHGRGMLARGHTRC